jgi:tripartite-type tricarboxylate transporter receptor subunit TctC
MRKPAFLLSGLLLICGCCFAIAQRSATWSPAQAVRIVVPFQAGGPIDTIARTVAQRLGEKWGQPFIVENRTGGGNIGMELVAKAPADGYTLGTASGGTHGANATLTDPDYRSIRSKISLRLRCLQR